MGCCPGRIGLRSLVQSYAPDPGVSPVGGIWGRGHFRDHAWCFGARGPVPARSTAGRQRPPRRPPGPAPGQAMTPGDEHDPAPSDRAAGRARPNFPTARGVAVSRGLPARVTEIWCWQLRGACRGLDGGVFFPPDHERGPARDARQQPATQLYRTCPVMDPWAIADEFIVADRERKPIRRFRSSISGSSTRPVVVGRAASRGRRGAGRCKARISRTAPAVAWLINILSARGEDLKAGSVVLSGGLVSPVPVRPGGVVSAEFDGLGTIEVHA